MPISLMVVAEIAQVPTMCALLINHSHSNSGSNWIHSNIRNTRWTLCEAVKTDSFLNTWVTPEAKCMAFWSSVKEGVWWTVLILETTMILLVSVWSCLSHPKSGYVIDFSSSLWLQYDWSRKYLLYLVTCNQSCNYLICAKSYWNGLFQQLPVG